MTDDRSRRLAALRAELAEAERAYLSLTAPLALAKAEAGVDPGPDDQARIDELAARAARLRDEIRAVE